MFDPLHKWLGIPPDEQPPNHYRMLGLTLFEDDPEVIDAAADKQMSYLHHLTNGEHAAEAEDLSNQISAARLCLLSDEKRTAYDERLRLQLNPRASNEAPATVGFSATSKPKTAPVPPVGQPVPVTPPLRRTRIRRQRESSLTYWHYSIVLCVVGLLVIAVALKRGLIGLDPQRMAWLGIQVEQTQTSQPPADIPSEEESAEESASEMVSPSASEMETPASRASDRPQLESRSSANRPPARPNQPNVRQPNVRPKAKRPSKTVTPDPKKNDSLVDLMHPSIALAPDPSSREPSNAPEREENKNDSVPDGKSLADAMALVSELYKDKYRDADTTIEKVALADQMDGDALQTKDDPVGRFALWKVSRDIYVREGRFDPALQIVDRLADRYEGIDSDALKAETLTASAAAVSGSDISKFVDRVVDVMLQLADDEKYGIAKKLGDFTVERFGARMIRSKRSDLAAIQSRVDDEGAKFAVYQTALDTLKQSPNDPRANQTAGIYLCLVRQRWNDGLNYLARGPESPITTAAKADRVPDKDVVAAIGTADAWYDLAAVMPDQQSRDAVLRRSLRWYAATQNAATGLARKKVDLRVKELAEQYPERIPEDAISIGADASGARVLDQRTRSGSESRSNFATVNGKTLIVGMGRRPDGMGQAEAGIELQDVKRITVVGSASHSDMITVDAYSKSGFVVDYHTSAGYVRRVFLGLGLEPARKFSLLPMWGKASIPDMTTDIGRNDSYKIDLTRFAPKDWDGRCWFTLLMQNAGSDRKIEAEISW